MIGNRLKQLREEKGMKQEELAKCLSVSPSAIGMYERNAREPNNALTLKICELFNCSVDYLIGKSDYKTRNEEISNYLKNLDYSIIMQFIRDNSEEFKKINIDINDINEINNFINLFTIDLADKEYTEFVNLYLNQFNVKEIEILKELIKKTFLQLTPNEHHSIIYNKLINIIDKDSDRYSSNKKTIFYMCPVYGQISAGQPNWAEECIEGRIPIDPSLMDIVDPEECFFLRVNGESMNKVIKNGSYALIRKTDWVENGEIAVVLVNGFDATLKKFSKQGDLVVLEPMSNDNSFQVQIYDKNTPIKILGKYIGKFEMNNG